MSDLFKAASAKMRANKKLKGRSPRVTGNQQIDDIATLRIDTQDHAGNGVCLSTRPITVIEGSLEGESCVVKVIKRSKRLNHGVVQEVLTASKSRKHAFCQIYDSCGGCSMQHVNAADGLAIKQAALQKYLHAHADVPDKKSSPWLSPIKTDIDYNDPDLSGVGNNKKGSLLGSQYGYRRRIRLAIDARNTKDSKVGFRRVKSNKVINVEHCPVAVNGINHVLPTVNNTLRTLPSLANVGHVIVTQGRDTVQLALYTIKPLCKNSLHILDELSQACNLTLFIEKKGHKSKSRVDNNAQIMVEDLSGVVLKFSSQDFLQVNASVNSQLLLTAIDWLVPNKQDIVYDFFSGAGNFSLAMAKYVAQVYGFEGVTEMVTKAGENAQDIGVTNCNFFCKNLSKAEDIEALSVVPGSLVILDPSRDGALALCQALEQSGARAILYVSCNANSFARDIKAFKHNYKLAKIRALDMFPFTKHLELMALFTLRGE